MNEIRRPRGGRTVGKQPIGGDRHLRNPKWTKERAEDSKGGLPPIAMHVPKEVSARGFNGR